MDIHEYVSSVAIFPMSGLANITVHYLVLSPDVAKVCHNVSLVLLLDTISGVSRIIIPLKLIDGKLYEFEIHNVKLRGLLYDVYIDLGTLGSVSSTTAYRLGNVWYFQILTPSISTKLSIEYIYMNALLNVNCTTSTRLLIELFQDSHKKTVTTICKPPQTNITLNTAFTQLEVYVLKNYVLFTLLCDLEGRCRVPFYLNMYSYIVLSSVPSILLMFVFKKKVIL